MQNTRNSEREINNSLRQVNGEKQFGKPEIILPLSNDGHLDSVAIARLDEVKSQALQIQDIFDELLIEFLLVEHPEYKKEVNEFSKLYEKFKSEYIKGFSKEYVGAWVYYPNGTLIHLLSATDHYRLRTSRNLGLITLEEQNKLRDIHVAIGGLSVGGLCATTLAMEGINSFYLTDFDQLACSNLNRISSSLSMIGIEKTDIIAQKIWDIDPFASVITNEDGYNPNTEKLMFNTQRMPDIVIDAMDSMDAKIAIREACRNHRIPLVWMVDMGDGVIQIGTERYDLNVEYPAFHGNLNKMEKFVGRPLNYVECLFSIFNQDYLPYRMAESLFLACNNQWPGISQLAGTVSIAAGAIAKVVRKITLGEDIIPEFLIEVDEKADPLYANKKANDRENTHRMMKKLGLR